jgi:ribosomal-protein-alanine N-acetyltransferase
MKIFAETNRIILRELVLEDAPAMFEMYSDPEVLKYLGEKPIQTIKEAEDIILFIRKQYEEFGIGRWAIVNKESDEFVGWGGLKYRTDLTNGHINYYDVGYRLIRRFWGQGYATESALASVKYAFKELNAPAVYAMANCDNVGSINALHKTGLKITGRYNDKGILCEWFEMTKEDWCIRNYIRPAMVPEAKRIAALIVLAMGDLAAKFAGSSDPDVAVDLFHRFVEYRGNQYSYKNVLVYEDETGICGMISAYDGAQLHALREPFLDYLKSTSGFTLEPEDETQEGEYYIDCLSVFPNQQGKGIGKMLIKALLKKVGAGITVGLLVSKNNPKAEKLYSSLGFKIVGDKEFMGDSYFHMQCVSEQFPADVYRKPAWME